MKLNIKDNAITNLLAMLYRDHGVGYKEPEKAYGTETDDFKTLANRLLSSKDVLWINDFAKIDIPGWDEGDTEKSLEYFKTFVGATVEYVESSVDEGVVEKTSVIESVEEEAGGYVFSYPESGLSLFLNNSYISVERHYMYNESTTNVWVKKVTLVDGTVVFDESKEVKPQCLSRFAYLPVYLGDIGIEGLGDDYIQEYGYTESGEFNESDNMEDTGDGVFVTPEPQRVLITTKDNAVYRGVTIKNKGVYVGGQVTIDYEEDSKGVMTDTNFVYKIVTPEIVHKIDSTMIETTE